MLAIVTIKSYKTSNKDKFTETFANKGLKT